MFENLDQDDDLLEEFYGYYKFDSMYDNLDGDAEIDKDLIDSTSTTRQNQHQVMISS